MINTMLRGLFRLLISMGALVLIMNMYLPKIFAQTQPGDFVDAFASGGGLNGPIGLVFGPDGDLYVSSLRTDEVVRYDGSTGTLWASLRVAVGWLRQSA